MELKGPAQIHQGHGAGLVGASHHGRLAQVDVVAELHRIGLCRLGSRQPLEVFNVLIGPVRPPGSVLP